MPRKLLSLSSGFRSHGGTSTLSGETMIVGWASISMKRAPPLPRCVPSRTRPLRIADNHLFDNGIRIEGTLGANVKCRVADNEFTHVGLELYLGPDTHDCISTDIRSFVDLGKNNRVSR